MDALLNGLRAAGEATRLRILSLLSGAELTVSELTQILNQSQPRVSRHLKLMCEAGLLQRFREGSWAFYRVADQGPAAELARRLAELLNEPSSELAEDKTRLEAVRRARSDVAAAYFARNASEWAKIRSLYVPEADVERAIVELMGSEPVDTLLDVGTGTGRILEVLSPLVRRGIGIDLSHEMLSIARANLERANLANCQVRHGDLFRLPFVGDGRGGVDAIVFHQVLHYLEDPAAAVAEAARVLAPRGRLLVADFAPHELEFLRNEHAHRRLGFSNHEVAQWASTAGLTVAATRMLPPSGEGKLTVGLWLLTKTSSTERRPARSAA